MAIYTRPRNEKKVAERLQKAGVEVYLPLQEQKKKWSDRWKTVKTPVISSYVFVKAEEKERSAILQDPAVLNFVFWQGRPAMIREEEINRIKFLLREAGVDDIFTMENLEPGELATVSGGQFAGEPVVIESAGKKEYMVVLSSLGVRLRLSKLNVEKIAGTTSGFRDRTSVR